MAYCKNYDDVLAQLQAIGLLPKLPLEIGTTKMVRCAVDGDREKRGWYRLHELPLDNGDTLIVGSFGAWRGDDNGAMKVAIPKADKPSISAEQMEAIKARQAADMKRAAAEERVRQERAAQQAGAWWRQCSEEGSSAYLSRKGIPAGQLFGARMSKSGNLVVPMLDGDAKVWGLQVIYSDPAIKEKKGRDKDFTPPGLAKKGHWFQIGSPVAGGIVLETEGFATGATLHLATGLPVIVAFDAGNLLTVARAIAKRYRGVRILFAADDDAFGKCAECKAPVQVAAGPDCPSCGKPHRRKNSGVEAAQNAALALDAAWVAPTFPSPDDRWASYQARGIKDSDFNDLHTHRDGGLSAVRTQIEHALLTAGWSVPNSTRRDSRALGGAGRPDPATGRPVAVSQLMLDDIVERFISIDDGTGDYVFDTWTREVCKRSKLLNMLPARVRGDDVKDHPVWKTRAVYIDQIGFDPAGTDDNIVCNRWQGWPMTPKPGVCDRLLDTLRYYSALESNHEEVFLWMVRWLAYPLQNPGAKMQSAMVIHGPQGTGKSRFFEAYAKIFGDYAIILNQGAIEDKFNSDWTERKLFVVADEIVARQDLYHLKNQLKNLITGEWVRVNPKNVAAHRERNHMNMVFLSNERQPVQLENDDRRHLVLWTPPAMTKDFYDELSAEIAAGGIAALYDYMLNVDLGDFHPWTRPPMTSAKQELVALSLSSEERFIADWQAGETKYPFCPCSSMDLYKAYRQYCTEHGVAKPRESNQFLGHVSKLPGWNNKRYHRYDDVNYLPPSAPQRMVIPSGTTPSTTKTQSQWLTDCHMQFRAVINNPEGYQ